MSARVRTIDGGTKYEGVFACPHCGHENGHWFGIWAGRPEVICCDVDSGGCDTYFAVTAVVDVAVTVTARKIEGIDLVERVERADADLDWTPGAIGDA